VLPSLDTVISAVNSLLDGRPVDGATPDSVAALDGWALLDAHTDAPLGPPSAHRRVRIMVTPSAS
jgi:hypothetical protein